MKLIIGLGNNPREKYKNTRHNTGFRLLGMVKRDLEGVKKDPGVAFFKNSGFINNSGIDVRKTINRLGVSLEDLLVIHDDLDLSLGQFRLQFGRSDAGHKGVRSVINALRSQDFWRLRIGVGRPPENVEADDYVLERFSPQEREVLDSIYPQILTTIKDWVLKT